MMYFTQYELYHQQAILPSEHLRTADATGDNVGLEWLNKRGGGPPPVGEWPPLYALGLVGFVVARLGYE